MHSHSIGFCCNSRAHFCPDTLSSHHFISLPWISWRNDEWLAWLTILSTFFDDATSEITISRQKGKAILRHIRRNLWNPRKIEKSQTRSFIKIRVFWFILSFAVSDQKKSKTSAKRFQEEKNLINDFSFRVYEPSFIYFLFIITNCFQCFRRHFSSAGKFSTKRISLKGALTLVEAGDQRLHWLIKHFGTHAFWIGTCRVIFHLLCILISSALRANWSKI